MATEPTTTTTTTTIKILEQSHVSPPPGSVPPTQIPLTFLDLPWFICDPIQRLFFYKLPQPTQHFTHTIIPKLKHSLSLALRHFFPLAATLLLPPPPQKPYLLYTGDSSVSLTVAESSAGFNHLSANYARDVKELHPFVPKLSHAGEGRIYLPPHNKISTSPPDVELEAPTYALPVLALQITVFPNFGLSVGTTYNHVAADGRSIAHFMKSWASICKTPNIELSLEQVPSHDRDVIEDQSEVESVYLESTYSRFWNSHKNVRLGTDLSLLEGMVRATFLMGRAHIQRLKLWVSAQFTSNEEIQVLPVSGFAVTCAFTWVHLIKSHAIDVKNHELRDDDDVICYFPFLADFRNRKGFEFHLPVTYFGNCLALCMVTMKRSELEDENGVFAAAKAIARRIKELENRSLGDVDNVVSDFSKAYGSGIVMTLSGSPNLRVYEIDFGWGRPKKCEIVHIDISRNVSLAESGEEEGGIEIGVALYKDKMDTFTTSFEQGLKLLLN